MRLTGWAFGVAVGLAVAAAWLASPELPSPARLLTIFLVAFLPALLVLQGRALRTADPADIPRSAVYLSSSIALWLLAGITLAAAWTSGFSWRVLGLVPLPAAALFGWSAAAIVAALAITIASRALGTRETELTEHVLPRTRADRVAFVGVSLTAGVCEELVFRSFLIPALVTATGSLAAAVVLSSATFGLLHGYQGTVGVVRTALLGLVLAVPFVLSGSVLPSMIAHVALDLILGIWMADWLLRR